MKAIFVFFALFALINAQVVPDLSSLDFKSVIGGPLLACVDAQAQATLSTMNFIESVAFYKDAQGHQQISTVAFSYTSLAANGSLASFTMNIPLITLVPIPYIEVREVKIDFNIKVNSVRNYAQTSSSNVLVAASLNARYMSNSLSFYVGVQSQSASSNSGEVKQEFSLQVSVRAGQGDLPAGTQRMLGLFERLIREDVPS